MRMNPALIAAAAVLALIAAVTSACGSTQPRSLMESIRGGSVILGTKFDQPGLGQREPDKTFTGFDTDISRYVVSYLADRYNGGKQPKLHWKETPSAQRETLIDNGEVDMIAATYSINAARSKKVSFAGPYLVTYQGLLVSATDKHPINGLDDLKGRKLCSVAGSTPAQNVKAQLPQVQLQEFDTYSLCVDALRDGTVAALTTDETILAGFADFRQYKNKFRLVSLTYSHDACVNDAYKKAGAPFSTERYGIGMSKKDPDSVAKVNEALNAMISSGVWEADLRKSLGNSTVDSWIARANAPGSSYKLFPTVGDLAFVNSKSTPCPGGAS